jgi:hypothetical protein
VARIQYKKGWEFRVMPSGAIMVTLLTDDAMKAGGGGLAQLGWTIEVSNLISDDFAVQEIYHAVQRMERHEASEWFKVDGKAIYNEHDLFPERFKGG